MVTADEVFRRAEAGLMCWVRDDRGPRHRLPLDRWMGSASASVTDRRVDEIVLSACTGSTVDLGCGPGRLTAALTRRGTHVLGVDDSAVAIEMCTARGGPALRHDLFAPLPRTGLWNHVLLADGNIGIGGDPLRLLRRAAELLVPGGTVIVEIGAPAARLVRSTLRFETDTAVGQWFPWATLGSAALCSLAVGAGLAPLDMTVVADRTVAVLVRS